MFTKEYVREVLEQVCAPYMAVPLSDEYVQKIYDSFVAIRNGEAVEHSVQRTGLNLRDDEEINVENKFTGERWQFPPRR